MFEQYRTKRKILDLTKTGFLEWYETGTMYLQMEAQLDDGLYLHFRADKPNPYLYASDKPYPNYSRNEQLFTVKTLVGLVGNAQEEPPALKDRVLDKLNIK